MLAFLVHLLLICISQAMHLTGRISQRVRLIGMYIIGMFLLDVHLVGVYGLKFTGHQRLTSYRRASHGRASHERASLGVCMLEVAFYSLTIIHPSLQNSRQRWSDLYETDRHLIELILRRIFHIKGSRNVRTCRGRIPPSIFMR
jgi:hypothetical protein